MQKYKFYYRICETSEEVHVETKVCKKPRLTKVFKNLLNMLDSGKAHTVGFRTP